MRLRIGEFEVALRNPTSLDEESQELVARRWVEETLSLIPELNRIYVEQFEDRTIEYEPGKSADLMILSYVTKQREHLRSVCVLLAEGCHRDSLLIARTMFEGYVQLRWACRRIPERTDLWMYFGVIRDFMQIEQNEQRGIPVAPEKKAELLELLEEHGAKYLTSQAAKAIRKSKNNPKANIKMPERKWRDQWTDTSMFQMVSEFETKPDIYNMFYGLPSEWVHWDPRTIFRVSDTHERGARGFLQADWRAASKALILAISSTLEILMLLDGHFLLGIREQIDRANHRLASILQESMALHKQTAAPHCPSTMNSPAH